MTSRRRTSWPTSTATTCRTCAAPWTATRARPPGRPARPYGSSCRPTASPACGCTAASTVEDEDGQTLISGITEADIAEAINAAQAVGDDRIQQETQGRVNQEQWTHGSAAERVAWFTKGYRTGKITACNTFAPNAL